MVVIFRCRNCGAILFRFSRVGQDFYGLPTPDELKARIGGRCPRCGSIPGRPTPDSIIVLASRAQLMKYLGLLSSTVTLENIKNRAQNFIPSANT